MWDRHRAWRIAANARRCLHIDVVYDRRIHGNDERVSLENPRAGVRSYTEMLLAIAAA